MLKLKIVIDRIYVLATNKETHVKIILKGKYMKQYKAIAGPRNFNVARGDTQAAFNAFAEIINYEASTGWEYHSTEVITVTEKPGCMQSAIPINYYMLIFMRDY